jgi:hypothetical protein
MPAPDSTARRHPSLAVIFAFFAVELLLILLLQLPAVADFQKFGFYDEGAWLNLDRLFAGGAIPTVDVGYSYGMLPLMLSRAWFAALGRTPWAFIGFVTACNLAAAWGMARILRALGCSWRVLAAACTLLPLAIMPNAYSLMHPLEMALIIGALSFQARNRYGWALALATLAVLSKPSMAYVLGLILLLLAWWLRKCWKVVIPPAIAGLVTIGISAVVAGMRPAYANILPLTGGRSYREMNFGIFHAGKSFWLHGGSAGEMLHYYLLSPALFWIAASLMVWGLGIVALVRLWHRRPADERASSQDHAELPRPGDPLLVTIALLHAAFVFVFYAWAGSWTYYSYLLVLGLLVGLSGKRQRLILFAFAALAVLGVMDRFFDSRYRWQGMTRSSEAGNLWVYPDVLDEARAVRELAQKKKTVYMVNGALPMIWPEAQTPPSWFISPGIPTEAEFKKTRAMLAEADLVVLCLDYDQNQEAWKWPQFAAERSQFDEAPVLLTKHFKVLGRRTGGAAK